MDARESTVMEEDSIRSHNMDDSGFFSVQVRLVNRIRFICIDSFQCCF
uniref:Ubiquitinyl hydrolase 1 n=1 Tax=Parascaris univalens TaxID=6257 RepID=A0A915CIC0_PARUN